MFSLCDFFFVGYFVERGVIRAPAAFSLRWCLTIKVVVKRGRGSKQKGVQQFLKQKHGGLYIRNEI